MDRTLKLRKLSRKVKYCTSQIDLKTLATFTVWGVPGQKKAVPDGGLNRRHALPAHLPLLLLLRDVHLHVHALGGGGALVPLAGPGSPAPQSQLGCK